jgi:hypothetical protein
MKMEFDSVWVDAESWDSSKFVGLTEIQDLPVVRVSRKELIEYKDSLRVQFRYGIAEIGAVKHCCHWKPKQGESLIPSGTDKRGSKPSLRSRFVRRLFLIGRAVFYGEEDK